MRGSAGLCHCKWRLYRLSIHTASSPSHRSSLSMDANASIIIHALKLRLHWSAGLGLLQRGDRARDWREFSVLKASGETGAAVTWRQYKKRKLFFQTQSLICSLSPRFLSMHCCYRFREGWEKNASCVSIKGALGFKYRWASGGRSVKKLLQVFFRTKQNCISEPRSSIDMHLGFFLLYVEAGRETRKVDWMCSCCRLTPWAETGGGLTLLSVSAPELKNHMRSLRGQITLFAKKNKSRFARRFINILLDF